MGDCMREKQSGMTSKSGERWVVYKFYTCLVEMYNFCIDNEVYIHDWTKTMMNDRKFELLLIFMGGSGES